MSTLEVSKRLDMKHNVAFRVIDQLTGKVVQVVKGHNSATNSMLQGIAHYLVGDGVLNQGYDMLNAFIPQYISLGTMGLLNQDEDSDGYPAGIGVTATHIDPETGTETPATETERFEDYLAQRPGYGADGYDPSSNNNRAYDGLGPMYADRPDPTKTIKCELISASFPRVQISYREVVPEMKAELPHTIDVVYSALISTGALAQFREPGKDYLFITEAGLWATNRWVSGGYNGLLAGYRIAPPDENNWDMTDPANRQILKENILRVGLNQVVQVVWKLQLGGIDDLVGGIEPEEDDIYWHFWDPDTIVRMSLLEDSDM